MKDQYTNFTIKTTDFTRKPLRGLFCYMMISEKERRNV